MAKKRLIGRGQVTLQDLTDSKTLVAYIGSTMQRQVIYDPDTESYLPDYGVTPIELIAELYMAGDPSNKIGEAKEITWYKQDDSMGDLVEISDDLVYQKSGDSLIITGNVLKDNNSMMYQAKIVFPFQAPDGTEEDMVVLASIELVKINSGSKGADGSDAIQSILRLPEGDTVRNHDNSLLIEAELYKGTKEVTPSSYQWYQLNPEALGDDLSGPGWDKLEYTGKSLEVTPEMFSGIGIYMSIVTYEGEYYKNTVTVKDVVDTTVTIIGPNAFKNGRGTIKLTAKVYDVGVEVDNKGTKYEYSWGSYDTEGNMNEEFTKVGKTITVTAEEVDNIVNLQCMVIKK